LMSSYSDYATFDGRGAAYRDELAQFEADFLYRLRTFLYGIRLGAGAITGRGGYAEPMANSQPRSAGFNYGYAEVEFRAMPHVAFLARGMAGTGKQGLGFGAEGRLRLGAEDETNLTL